jgi:hypothetical protein
LLSVCNCFSFACVVHASKQPTFHKLTECNLTSQNTKHTMRHPWIMNELTARN